MPFFDIFASPRGSPLRMRTKVVSFFIFFQELSNKKKIKALRPKMTNIASRGVLPILANRPDLVGTVPIWRSKPDVPPDDPKKADSSRFVPINAQKHDFNPAFCLFLLFFSQNSSFFFVFWPFFMYPSVVGSYPIQTKNLYTQPGHCSG